MRCLPGILLCCLPLFLPSAAECALVVFLGGANDTDLAAEAFADLQLPRHIVFEYYCTPVDSPEKISERAKKADILIINSLVKELRELVAGEIDFSRTTLYAFSARRLPENVPALEPPEIKAYRANRRPENFRNMIYWIVNRHLEPSVAFEPPVTLPEIGVTHPAAAGQVFPSIAAYREWAMKNGFFRPENGVAAFAVHSAGINAGEMKLFRHLTDELERQGVNTAIVYGDEVRVINELLLDADGKQTVDALLALSFKFKSGLGEPLRQALKKLDMPVFNALRLYRQTTPEWEASLRGMNDFAVAFGFTAPEISGMIEPSLLFGSRNQVNADGRTIQLGEPFPAQIKITAQRLKKWIGLRRKDNSAKKVVIFIYNGSGGKQAIGASYLNVPRSLCNIVRALAREQYDTGGLEALDEAAMTSLLLQNARNIGSWAPGELEAFLDEADVVRFPVSKYLKWFAELPENFRRGVIDAWGQPGRSAAMTVGGDFILPMLRRGNLVILPEPMRGWLDDPHKLVHSATLAPPHQYLAVYLWLRHEFNADAMVHLGRHGSSEWLPGKQLGLSAECAPLLVRGDIPEIYPYISDGIGEGIIAKRRASAVMIDHLTPFLKVPAEDRVLLGLRQKITAFQAADPAVREQREGALFSYVEEHGLSERLGLDRETPDWWHELEHYADARGATVPFGLHSFGESPSREEIAAMLAQLPEPERPAAARHLANAGADELNSLLRALSGRFIEPGPSGDPLRNPDSLPVGRNFYSFDPAVIPTAEAVAKGTQLARELLDREFARNNRYPAKIAIILWAGETTRTDGVNEAMALALMGMRPQYDRDGRVTGVIPVPGALLNRPRIDVLITTSGAYRDQFGALIQLLDRAQRQAARLTDAENFIRRNSEANAAKLRQQGHSTAAAAELSARRIFFPAPATYGTRLNKLAGASGVWTDDDELAAVYLNSMGYSINAAGEFDEARAALDAGLTQVEAMFHSRSSNVYGVTDIDDMFQYFGGLSLAVRKNTGKAPEEYIIDQRRRSVAKVTSLKSFMGAELDSRLYNREWIEAMMREKYSGAKTIARMTDNVWGWQAVTPDNLSAADWRNLYEIYVEDRYALNMKEFFADDNEWAFQSMTGRMLEAIRKDYWQADLATRQSLAAGYAQSVIRRGMACCDHTCNNPLLNQVVTDLISIPGVLSPEAQMKFQVAVEKAAARILSDQVRERRDLQRRLGESFGKDHQKLKNPPAASRSSETQQTESAPKPGAATPVKGFKLEAAKANADQTNLSSSGLKWAVLGAVLLLMALFAWGCGSGER